MISRESELEAAYTLKDRLLAVIAEEQLAQLATETATDGLPMREQIAARAAGAK